MNGLGTSRAFPEALDRIARSSHAAFARDSGERIILWNKRCEELFGLPARSALGKHCHDVHNKIEAVIFAYRHRLV